MPILRDENSSEVDRMQAASSRMRRRDVMGVHVPPDPNGDVAKINLNQKVCIFTSTMQ
jgi:hypothetical protein